MDIKKKERLSDSGSGEDVELSLYLRAAYDVVSILSESFPDGHIPFVIKTRKIICGSEINEENYEYFNPWFYLSIEGWAEKYKKKESVREYLAYMFQNEIIDMPRFSDGSGKELDFNLEESVRSYIVHSDALIVFPIIDVILVKKNFNLSSGEILDSYKKYIGRRKSPYIEKALNTPIIGFESEIECFKFSDEFTLEILSDRYKNSYSELSDVSNGYSMHELCDMTHMIRWSRKIPRGDDLRFDHEKYLYLLLMSIRLSTSSDVVAKFSYSEPKDCLSIAGIGGSWHFETSRPWGLYDSHTFYMSDLIRAKKVYSDLLRLEKVKGYKNLFNVVLKRYLSSLSRATPEDAVIDFTICLESLLLANEREELKFRLSLRGAIILTDCDPVTSKKTLASMYDDRSAIVHNGKTLYELRKADSTIHVKKYRKIAENIILAYINKSKDFGSIVEINENLDQLCLYAGMSNG